MQNADFLTQDSQLESKRGVKKHKFFTLLTRKQTLDSTLSLQVVMFPLQFQIESNTKPNNFTSI